MKTPRLPPTIPSSVDRGDGGGEKFRDGAGALVAARVHGARVQVGQRGRGADVGQGWGAGVGQVGDGPAALLQALFVVCP